MVVGDITSGVLDGGNLVHSAAAVNPTPKLLVLGVLTLVALSEISKRHWRLKPAKEATNFFVIHTDLQR
jgi:hypothetical protein